MDIALFLVGLLIIASVIWDVFESIVVPRPTPGRYRIARNLVRGTWVVWRAVAFRARTPDARERMLGTYAPIIVLVLLACWVILLVFGYGLILFALRGQLDPSPDSLAEASYVAGVSLLTIGFGEFVPTGVLARAVSLVAAASGLGVVALVITYLFSLYGAFQRREVQVVTLDARAGAPPSAVNLLETYARTGMVDELPRLFGDWEVWSAEVLDSHVAYPILGYFRSTHDNESWVSSLGAVMDAATLVLTTIEGVPHGRAEMLVGIGQHLVEDVANYFGFPDVHAPGVERFEFDEARDRLAAAGYQLRDADLAWSLFADLRSLYAVRLNSLATYWLTPPAQWVGDRSVTRHHENEADSHAGLILKRPGR